MTVNTNMTLNTEALFISDLPFNTTSEEILELFTEFQHYIVDISFKRVANPRTDPVISCFVNFKDGNIADQARRAFNMTRLKNKTIRVMRNEKITDNRYKNDTNVYINNIPINVSGREIYVYFLQFGDIRSTKLPEKDGVHMGYGYINYFNKEDAIKAIKAANDQEVWGSQLKVEFFVNKGERNSSMSTAKNTIYVRNIASSIDSTKLSQIFTTYGAIKECVLSKDLEANLVAKIIFEQPESASKAVDGENGKQHSGLELFVDIYKTSKEREVVNNNKRYANNVLYSNSHSNIVVRHLPYEVNEETLTKVFGQFGNVVSVNIIKFTNVSKQGGEFITTVYNKGYAYVQFESSAQAETAISQMNGKNFPGYEDRKVPLAVEIYKNKYNKDPRKNFVNPDVIQPMMGFNMVNQMNYVIPNVSVDMPMMNVFQTVPIIESPITFDKAYLNGLEDDASKKDYLGEILYKKIEVHPVVSGRLGLEEIGKITGMILGIDDIKEIIEIAEDSEQLRLRIEEACSLMEIKK